MTETNPQELRQLIDAHGAALLLYARQWCRNPDDVLQEALIELLRQNPAPDSPVAWLHNTVRRRAMNVARAEHRRDKYHRRTSRLFWPSISTQSTAHKPTDGLSL